MHRSVRFGFCDFLLGLQKVAAVLCQIVFLLAGIKFEHDVALVNLCSEAGQFDDLQGSPGDGRSRDHPRVLAAQGAGGERFQLHIGLLHRGRGNIQFARQSAGLSARNDGACENQER